MAVFEERPSAGPRSTRLHARWPLAGVDLPARRNRRRSRRAARSSESSDPRDQHGRARAGAGRSPRHGAAARMRRAPIPELRDQLVVGLPRNRLIAGVNKAGAPQSTPPAGPGPRPLTDALPRRRSNRAVSHNARPIPHPARHPDAPARLAPQPTLRRHRHLIPTISIHLSPSFIHNPSSDFRPHTTRYLSQPLRLSFLSETVTLTPVTHNREGVGSASRTARKGL